MKLNNKLPILGASLALAAATFATVQNAVGEDPTATIPVTQSPLRLLHAQPFFLDQEWSYDWRADRPSVSAGYILVVSGDPRLIEARQVHDELLFVGDMPVAQLNTGTEAGVFIGFLPSAGSPETGLEVDLTTAPMFLAKPEILPESLQPEDARRVLEQAVAAGAAPQRAAHVKRALAESSGPVFLESHGMLQRYSADFVERYSPQEVDLVRGLRAPLLKK